MIKRRFIKKVFITSSVLFAFLLMCLIPNDNKVLEPNQELKYVNSDLTTLPIYLLDSYDMLGRIKVTVSSKEVDKQAKELLEILIKEKGDSKIPSGFKAVIPSDTVIKSLSYKDGLIKVDFSSNLLDVSEQNETKVIEAIIYTLTSIDGVDKVIIYVDGNILTKLPKSKINLPSTLDRSYGINRSYSITTYKDISGFNVYYLNKYNDITYYVPVTKYVNDNRDKVEIIIDELSVGYYDNNMMSYLNYQTKLKNSKYQNNEMCLTFNEYIFSDIDNREILDEVITSISLSIADSYDVDLVVFNYKEEEIYKSVIKMLE